MNRDVIELDGSSGGGQVLRSALSLSMITGRALHIHHIRGQRSRPGLLRQHLTAVLAAARICEAQVSGAELGSQALWFEPGKVRAGDYEFAIGSAGSCTLVLQTLLPALLLSCEPSRVSISGGTHNPMAPAVDFLQRAWLPQLRRMGAQVELELLRHGFVPAGGGQVQAMINPSRLTALHLHDRGAEIGRHATALSAGLPEQVAMRELARVGQRLSMAPAQLHTVVLDPEQGPGNALLLVVECEQVTEVFSAFGQSNLRAEAVADRAILKAVEWLHSDSAVAEHLADQLLLPMALAGGGSFSTLRMTDHLLSNIAVIERFLPVRFDCHEASSHRLLIECRAA
ncbi:MULTISPECIES: RNA 3'-terminal phosphate cyclase [Pseudomonas syringae group]|uniref:RNA 3'-terminal phosphate cyclase n=1 Tax=Pseudomonas syringae group TaxID=136849 RepID=UPI000F02F136|nr:RNA 3'-terminal phosphate cyclase [Pseudomonas viridiflava]MCF8979733.1 RNA 3'-terminal phosphate cyclase [Pseudomonas syringae]MEE4085800.1 RNA 3'-terminal phosphate cyclase [Pseudomonas viridiflava]